MVAKITIGTIICWLSWILAAVVVAVLFEVGGYDATQTLHTTLHSFGLPVDEMILRAATALVATVGAAKLIAGEP